jgi:hypothetical protein
MAGSKDGATEDDVAVQVSQVRRSLSRFMCLESCNHGSAWFCELGR